MQGENWWRGVVRFSLIIPCFSGWTCSNYFQPKTFALEKLFWNLMEYRNNIAPLHIYSDRQKTCVLEDVRGDLPSQGTWKCSYPADSVLHPSVEKPDKAPFPSSNHEKPQLIQFWMFFALLSSYTELQHLRRNSLAFLLVCGKKSISFLFVRLEG